MENVTPNLNIQQMSAGPICELQTTLCEPEPYLNEEQMVNPQLKEELNCFKDIQKNPQLLLQTLAEMEKRKKFQMFK